MSRWFGGRIPETKTVRFGSSQSVSGQPGGGRDWPWSLPDRPLAPWHSPMPPEFRDCSVRRRPPTQVAYISSVDREEMLEQVVAECPVASWVAPPMVAPGPQAPAGQQQSAARAA